MRIGIVNDMPIAVEVLKRVVQSTPGLEIAWIAYDGAEATQKCAEVVPDVVLMDLIMPVIDGVEATRRIMKDSPCAILVVTATVEGNMAKVFDAMGYGALDAVATPVVGPDGTLHGADALLVKIATIGKLLGKAPGSKIRPTPVPKQVPTATGTPSLILIGASTGGPKALALILSELPERFDAAIAVIQHVDIQFAHGLVVWLNSQIRLPVVLAAHGMRLEKGKIFIAGTNDHLIMNPDLSLAYTTEPQDYPYRPSVDVFFKSIATCWPGIGAAVLLTGMGTDGAKGLRLLRDAGWYTIAQDKQTSVVYGMPKAAARLNAALDILPVEMIGKTLVNWFDARSPFQQKSGIFLQKKMEFRK